MSVLDVQQKLRPAGVLQRQILRKVDGIIKGVLVAEVIPLVPADHVAKVFLIIRSRGFSGSVSSRMTAVLVPLDATYMIFTSFL